MNNHSVIFIEHPEVEYERLNRPETIYKKNKLVAYFLVSPLELPQRILSSFIPPIFGNNSRKVYVDLVGPLIAIILLASVLQYGHANKHPKALIFTSPTVTLLYYITFVPIACLTVARVGNANLSPPKILALLGYGLYGHLFTVIISLLFDPSNGFFFTVMVIFGGTSCFKIVIVLLLTIPKPVCRLLICSLVSIFHLLFLVFIHFAYMHKTFMYGVNS